jgi:hypothetical protein
MSRLTLRSTSRHRRIAVHIRGPLLGPAPPGPERRACGGVSIAAGVVRMQKAKTMASKQSNKQAMSAAQINNSIRKPEHQRRRHLSRGRSKSTATQTSSGARRAAVAPDEASESIDLSKNTIPSPEHQAAQSKLRSDSADLASANAPGADRPRASTKRAVLIGMFERAEGVSVTELG